jgi:hypothetical protein
VPVVPRDLAGEFFPEVGEHVFAHYDRGHDVERGTVIEFVGFVQERDASALAAAVDLIELGTFSIRD